MMPMRLAHRPITSTNAFKKCSQRMMKNELPMFCLQKRLVVAGE